MDSGLQIAIDGPVASGKGTVSRKLADTLGFLYVDTGAMYRAVTLLVLEKRIDFNDEQSIAKLVPRLSFIVRQPAAEERDGRSCTILVDGRDVSLEIRSSEVTKYVARVAALASVRKELVAKQREIVKGKNVVMEGRDITTVVLPNADLKIYLDAKVDVRIERRYQELRAAGKKVVRDKVAKWLRERDKMDEGREASPLKIAKNVWYLDSSDLGVDTVVDAIRKKVESIIALKR